VADAFRPFFEVISAGAVQLGEFVQSETFTAWAKTVADTTRDAFRQIGDAVRTVQQVLASDWAPSDSIEPFALAVGNAAVMLRDTFGPAISAAARFVTGTLIPAVQQFAGPIAAFVAGFTGAVAAVGAAGAAIALVTGILGALLSPLTLVAIAVGLLAAAWTTDFLGIQEATAAFIAYVTPAFQGLVALVQQALSGDIAGAFAAFVALIAAEVPVIVAQLLLWGQAFVDWVAPMIPPLLAALGAMLQAMLDWLTTQVATIATALTAWFTSTIAGVEWATLATSTGALLGTMTVQAITMLLTDAAVIASWLASFTGSVAALDWNALGQSTGALLVTMVTAAIGLVAAAAGVIAGWLASLVASLAAVDWGAVAASLGTLLTSMVSVAVSIASIWAAFGTGFLSGIVQGITGMSPSAAISALGAWVQGVIDSAISSIHFNLPMPSFGGGGVPGATQMSAPARSPGGTHASPYMDLINKVAAQEHEDAALVAAIMDTEGSGQGSTSPAGARGLMQVMPNYVLPGENPFDPETSIRQGIRAIKEKRAPSATTRPTSPAPTSATAPTPAA
jgi:hypothetical protein